MGHPWCSSQENPWIAAFPAITAVCKVRDAYVAVDASGTFSETKRQVGLLAVLQAGVIVSDYPTLMVEIPKDNARPEAGEGLRGHGIAVGQARGPDRRGPRGCKPHYRSDRLFAAMLRVRP